MRQFQKFHTLYFILFLAGLIVLSGCKTTRLVPEGEYLLTKNVTEIDSKDFDKGELLTYYRQKPNRNIFQVVPFFLSTYNFSKLGKPRKWKTWIERVIGEEPVIYDSVLTVKTTRQFELLLKNQAYYNSKVSFEVEKENKKAQVTYKIKLGDPIYINRVDYLVKDTSIYHFIFSDTAASYLKPGELFALDFLQKERDRIVKELRDSGYYNFTDELIRYIVDTTGYKANIQVEINKAVFQEPTGEIVEKPNQQYWINNVYIFPDYDPQLAIRNKSFYYQTFDTVRYGNFYFVYSGKQRITPRTILKANLIKPGMRYNATLIGNTGNYISSLRLFRLNNITFNPVQGNDSLLNCEMLLTPFTYQGYSANFEATNTQGNLGIGGNLNYQHKNLFHGAEIFNVKISGSLQRQPKQSNSLEAYNIIELGAESSLETPSFILPFRLTRFYLKYNPKTSFSLSYNYQQRPDFTRTITSLSMTYLWKGNAYVKHFVTPCDFNTVKISKETQSFINSIKGKYIENSYKDYFIIGGRYSLLYQDKGLSKRRDFNYFRWNVELAGNLLDVLVRNTNFGTKDYSVINNDTLVYYTIDSLQFAQFSKTDIDYRFYHTVSQRSQMVFRLFAGMAIPYGNATGVPFVRQYYAGGAEGMRGWRVRDLGPGSYNESDSSYPNQTGDVKLEFNMEYRYDISNSIKGAYFVDIGNIWLYTRDEARPGAEFKANQFYKQFAVGTGLGLRFDMTYAVFRLDGGIKLRDPSLTGNDSWILFHERFRFKKIMWQFGIGYPF